MTETHFHTLTGNQFITLAEGFGDATTIQSLRVGLHNKWLMTLRTIIASVENNQIEASLALLDKAREADPDAFAELLAYPYVNVWAWACLERAMGMTTPDSLDAHLDYFRAFAAVAAYRSGIDDFAISVTVRNGIVTLPTLGCVPFNKELLTTPSSSKQDADVTDFLLTGESEIEPTPPETSREGAPAVIRGNAGVLSVESQGVTVVVPADHTQSSETWWGIRPLSTTSNGLTINVALDDVDPYRRYGTAWTAAAARLEDKEVEQWQGFLDDAWKLLTEHHNEYAVGISEGLRVVTPLVEQWNPTVDHLASGFGAVVLPSPQSPTWLAYLLLDSFQKAKLTALHDLLPLHQATHDEVRYYAPWYVAEPRALRHLLEGLYTHPSSIKFWEKQRQIATDNIARVTAEVTSALWQSRFGYTKTTIELSGEISGWGARVLEHLVQAMKSLQIHPTSGKAWSVARETNLDRRIAWRLRNLRVDRNTVEQLVDAWMIAATCPTEIPVHLKIEARSRLDGHARRHHLRILGLANPGDLQDLLARSGSASRSRESPSTMSKFTEADLLLASHHYEEALAVCKETLRHDPQNTEAWAAFSLAQYQHDPSTISSVALHRSPEFVYEVYKEIQSRQTGDLDPSAVAAWLNPLLSRLDDASLCRA